MSCMKLPNLHTHKYTFESKYYNSHFFSQLIIQLHNFIDCIDSHENIVYKIIYNVSILYIVYDT